MKKIKAGLLFIVGILFMVSVVSLEEVSSADAHLASCSQSDVQAAIDSANDGDTIYLPACDVVWDTTVTIPNTKGVSIIGAGVGNTRITGTADPKFKILIASDRSTSAKDSFRLIFLK